MEILKELKYISWLVDDSEWKVIPGIEDYIINKYGVVKALPKIREGRFDGLKGHTGTTKKSRRYYKEHIIKPKFTSRYWYVTLSHNSIKKSYRIHRLVYLAFRGPIPENMVIDHIDGNRNNNSLDNLRCVTQANNVQNPNTKFNGKKAVIQLDASTEQIINRYNSAAEAEAQLTNMYIPGKQGIHILDCCKGKRKTALGYKWKYE